MRDACSVPTLRPHLSLSRALLSRPRSLSLSRPGVPEVELGAGGQDLPAVELVVVVPDVHLVAQPRVVLVGRGVTARPLPHGQHDTVQRDARATRRHAVGRGRGLRRAARRRGQGAPALHYKSL